MNAREDILARLRRQARGATLPPPWRSRRRFEDLSKRFVEALTAAGGEVRQASNLDEALKLVGFVLAEVQARTAVVNAQPPLDGIDLASLWPEVDWLVVGRSEGDPSSGPGQTLRAFCTSADVGLSVADAALAETGTAIVSSGPGQSRLTSLLPPIHMVLLPLSRLTTDVFTWTAGRHGNDRSLFQTPLPAAVTMISGPSKTADIEQTMAIGVHGPKRFIAILYSD